MTNPTPHGQVPEALAHERDRAIMEGERNASLDAYSRVVLLTSAESRLYEAALTNGWDRCAAHVQKPAKNEHVAGDVSKNGAEANMRGAAYAPMPRAAYIEFDGQEETAWHTPDQMRAFADRTHALRMEQAAPKAAPGDALDEAMRERDDAEDFIDELLDEVLGADRPEWSSAYNRYDTMNDVRERMTALHKPAVDKAWGQFQSTKAAPQQAAPASNESAYQRGYMDGMAKSRRDAGAAPQQEAQEPVASVHRDTLAMLNSGQVRPWDGGARAHPPSRARFDTAYAPLYAATPTAQAEGAPPTQLLGTAGCL